MAPKAGDANLLGGSGEVGITNKNCQIYSQGLLIATANYNFNFPLNTFDPNALAPGSK